jgi:hypothetical protein
MRTCCAAKGNAKQQMISATLINNLTIVLPPFTIVMPSFSLVVKQLQTNFFNIEKSLI